MREGWRTVPLGNFLTLERRRTSVNPADTYKLVTLAINGKGARLRKETLGSEVGTAKYLVRAGDLMVSKIDARKGANALLPMELDGALVTADFLSYSIDTELAMKEFVDLWVRRPEFAEMCDTISGGTTNRVRMDVQRFPDLRVPLPPLEEQRRIVDLIGALDDAIAAARRSAHALGEVLAARRELAFNTERRRPASEVFDILIGLQRSPARAKGPQQTKYLRSANVLPGRLKLDDVKTMSFTDEQREKYALRPGDVLVSEGSASAHAVGAPSEYHGEIDDLVGFQNTLLRYRAVPGVTTPSFVSQWCSWAYESGAFRDAANGTNIKHIGARGASRMLVADVAFEEQQELTAELEDAQAASERATAVIDTLEVLRTNLLTALLSGEHEIPETYDGFIEEVA